MSGGVLGPVVLGGAPQHRFECSRARCDAEATTAILWRNPKIHGAERRKTWLACADHLELLSAFLAARDFPMETRPVEELDD